ncbi:MAG: class I SAM-dependent methyltransferase [Myxococcales bacterium]
MSGTQSDIVEQFTRQVDRFVASPHVNAEEPVRRFVELIQPQGREETLDVACGPGLLARALAPRVGRFTGLDLTQAMIAKAREIAAREGLGNARFEVGDATALPFADASFDLAVTRLALHHIPEPSRALAEMARVLRPGGRLAVFDIQASEIPEEEGAQNEIERLRDPSHARALPLSELVAALGRLRLTVERLDAMSFPIDVADWLARAFQPPEAAAEVRRRLATPGPRAFGGRPLLRTPEGHLVFETRYMMVLATR